MYLIHSPLRLWCTAFVIPVILPNKYQSGLSKGLTGCTLSPEACGVDVVSLDGMFESELCTSCPGYGKCQK